MELQEPTIQRAHHVLGHGGAGARSPVTAACARGRPGLKTEPEESPAAI